MAATTDLQNYYQVLSVGPAATPHEVRQAYLRKLQTIHPAIVTDRDAMAFRRVRRAYEVLADPAERAQYDMLLGLGPYAGHMRFYRRAFSHLFEALGRRRQNVRPIVLWTPEEAASQRRRAG